MLTTLRQALDVFEARDRWVLAGLFLLIVVMAIVQTASIASILPFMSLVADPDAIQEVRVLEWMYDSLAFETTRSFLVFIGVLVLALTAFSNAISALTQWVMLRFTWDQQYRLSARLLARYLSQPYPFYLRRNTSGLVKTMFVEVGESINGVIMPGMKVIAHSVVAVCIFGLLLSVDPVLAVISTFILGGAYGVLYWFVRSRQAEIGRTRTKVNTQRFQTAGEALGGIKESRVLGQEVGFLERFIPPARRYSRVSARNAIVVELPRYALETLAFGGILVIVLYILNTRDDFGQAVAVMSLYALAGYRLMPAMQKVFSGLAKARFYTAALNDLHQDLVGTPESPSAAVRTLGRLSEPALPFERGLALKNVTFSYPGSDERVLKAVTLAVLRHQTVGLVGSTGSGKTTTVDLILGLLEATTGWIEVDGKPLRKDEVRAWRCNVGYVPQEIFLCDDTVVRNIAFGIPDDRIDLAAVERAARMAQVHKFIESLPDGYRSVVGERGVRLSGGQRQRIGIARALYRDPPVLVLDEATSALDGITEDGVMEAIRGLLGRKTIIVVAHRVSTLRDCDRIYLFHEGVVADAGTYDELMMRNERFRGMAKAPDAKPVAVP